MVTNGDIIPSKVDYSDVLEAAQGEAMDQGNAAYEKGNEAYEKGSAVA